MGIQFRCFECEHAFNVKDFQGGKKAKCPKCSTLLRIPAQSAEYALRVNGNSPQRSPEEPLTAPVQDKLKTQSSVPANEATELAEKPSSRGEQSRGEKSSKKQARKEQPSSQQPPDSTPPRSAAPDNAGAPPATTMPSQGKAGEAGPAAETAEQAEWFVVPPGGQQFGPADEATFQGWLSEGRVSADALVWTSPWEQWQPAIQAFPERFAQPASPAVSQRSPVPPPINHPQQPSSVSQSADSVPPASAPSGEATGFESVSPVELKRLNKRLKRKRNYRIALAMLFVLAVILVIVLAVVLMQQER